MKRNVHLLRDLSPALRSPIGIIGAIMAASCSSSATGGDGVQSMEGGASDAMAATGDSGPADAGGSPADAGGSPADAGGSPADAPAADTASGDAAKQCPSFASATVDCSRSCYGNCYGQNAGGGADPSVHIGDCFITITGGIIVYCAPYGASDPCTHCP